MKNLTFLEEINNKNDFLDLLKKDGIMIIETDEEERILKEIENTNVNVYDLRKYGRVKLIFLNRKG